MIFYTGAVNINIMKKTVIIINGAGGAGKDTVCGIIAAHYKAKSISAIDPIKSIAIHGGWEYIDKSLKARKLLSDIKLAFVEYNDLPFNHLLREYSEFIRISNETEILIAHIREPFEIEKFKAAVSPACACITLLVKSDKSDSIIFGNASDDDVTNYNYDYIYENSAPLKKLEEDFMNFFEKEIKIRL